MSKVYVVQHQHKWDPECRTFVPKFDMEPAQKFGELTELLSPTAAPFRSEPLIKELHQKLKGIKPDDYLLLIGNPVLIGVSVAIAAMHSQGELNVLQWSGKDGRYLVVKLQDLFTF